MKSTEQVNLPTRAELNEIFEVISELSMKLEKAETIMQDLTDDYFGLAEDNLKDKEIFLLYEYKAYSNKANIVFDYLFGIRQDEKKAEELIDLLANKIG